MGANLLERKETGFVLWRAGDTATAPALIIGQLRPGAPVEFTSERRFNMSLVTGFTDLWEVAAEDCGLTDGQVYHYWFEVNVSQPGRPAGSRLRVTDPMAFMVDWRLRGPRLGSPFGDDDRYPAAVIKFSQGRLIPADPGADLGGLSGEPSPALLPANNQVVIYELPTT